MFRLVRYFVIASLAAFAVVTVALGAFYRQTSVNRLIDLGESKNVALTQSFANALWPEFRPFVEQAGGMSEEELRERPEMAALREAAVQQTRGLSVIKIKVYNLDGLTVFSSEEAQIGEDKSENPGYLAARGGEVATELTHRDTFSAFEGTIEDRDVISSYVPIYGEGGEVEGVFEVYDDVTPLLERIAVTQRTVVGGVVAILALLWIGLYLIVRRGERIIQEQSEEIVRSSAQLASVLETVGEGIVAFRADERIALSNQEVANIWGYPSAELPEMKVSDLFTDTAGDRLRSVLAEYGASGDRSMLEQRREVAGRRIDGTQFPVEINLSETTVNDSQLFTAAVRDITERKEAAQALEAHNQQLARVNEFTHLTVDHTINMIQRGAHHTEILEYMKQAQEQFDKIGKF